ncbi:HEPN domain-containing protein [Tenacibaculum discolor]|uniref:HEPN domain-containing protein n=1 Tax=Tenacibaculum discolor TaxID=361581 RepID=UPI000EB228F5|nr:hypothetical protein [Tenacibaculum discolor]RLK06702.1 hypothetical protein C8N27_0262 [Tenacibaculum discolor]
MKKTTLRFNINTLSGYDFYPFLDVANLIDYSLELRNQTSSSKLKTSINYNIILQCCTFLEGSLGQIFDSIIEFRKNNILNSNDKYKEYTIQTLNDLEKRIDKAQWMNYPDIYNSLFGHKLSSKINNESWKAFQIMFKLRNAITHGNVITIEYTPIDQSNNCKIEVLKKYSDIYDYFSEKKLIETNTYGFVHLMNDKVANYFAEKIPGFIQEIVNSITDKSEQSIIMNRLMYLNEKKQDKI